MIPHRRHRPAPGGFAKDSPHFVVETGHRQPAGHGFDIAARGIGLSMATQENIRIPPHMGNQFALENDRFMQGDLPRKIIPRDIGGDAFLKAAGPEDIETEGHILFSKHPGHRDQILRPLHRLKPPGKHQAQGSVAQQMIPTGGHIVLRREKPGGHAIIEVKKTIGIVTAAQFISWVAVGLQRIHLGQKPEPFAVAQAKPQIPDKPAGPVPPLLGGVDVQPRRQRIFQRSRQPRTGAAQKWPKRKVAVIVGTALDDVIARKVGDRDRGIRLYHLQAKVRAFGIVAGGSERDRARETAQQAVKLPGKEIRLHRHSGGELSVQINIGAIDDGRGGGDHQGLELGHPTAASHKKKQPGMSPAASS